MTDVILLHDNAGPHTSLRTREAIAKMWWTVLPHPAHSPDLAPSDCHLFGLVKNALHGHHFAHNNELKRSFRDALRSWSRMFYNTGTQRLTQRSQMCVQNGGDSVEKLAYNCKRCMNHPCKFLCYCNHIFWEKIKRLFSYRPSYAFHIGQLVDAHDKWQISIIFCPQATPLR
jgi:hypothetical protein